MINIFAHDTCLKRIERFSAFLLRARLHLAFKRWTFIFTVCDHDKSPIIPVQILTYFSFSGKFNFICMMVFEIEI